jgi:hypothetical protein
VLRHEEVCECIGEVLRSHQHLLAVALRQRAKFEGWLKLELAAHLMGKGAESVTLEAPYGSKHRADIGFAMDGARFLVELKTPNANWRLPGVADRVRPITRNVAGIVEDARKLAGCGTRGFVAFVLFPIPISDSRWHTYLSRISEETGIRLTESRNCLRMTVVLRAGHECEAVVCCFATPA